MPFTTGSLATFMVTTLGPSGVALGLTVASAAIVDAVAEFEAVVGMATAEMTDDLKTRIIARWLAWRTAKGAAAGQYDLASSGDSLKRSQLWDHIDSMLRDAEAAASVYPEVAAVISAGSLAYVSGMSTSGSPYQWNEWE